VTDPNTPEWLARYERGFDRPQARGEREATAEEEEVAPGPSAYLKPSPLAPGAAGERSPAAPVPVPPRPRVPLAVVAGATVALIALVALAGVLVGPRVESAFVRAGAQRAAARRADSTTSGRAARRSATESRPGTVALSPLPKPYERLAGGPVRLGVTYFAGVSREGDDAHLAEFITHAVVVRLRQSRDHAGRPLVPSFIAPDASVPVAATAAYALTGTIGRVGDAARSQVRITAADGTVIWRDELDRPIVDLVRLAEDVSARVAARLGARLPNTGRADASANAALPDSTEAFDRLLRGRYLRSRYDGPSLEASVAAYATVAKLDPRSALAQAELALASARLARWNGPRPEYFAGGRAAAERALALDSTLATAWAARAAVAAQQPGPVSPLALAWARRALALAPRSPEGERALALAYLQAGNAGAAEAALRRILARNPDDPDALVEIAGICVNQRRWNEVRTLADRAVAADPKAIPAYAFRALARVQQNGGIRGAFSDAETATQLGRPVWGDAVRAQIQVVARDRDGARATVRRLVERVDKSHHPLSTWDERLVASAVAAAGDPRARDLRYQRRG
jgi:tetratricopeptide (TPR) repeat protein